MKKILLAVMVLALAACGPKKGEAYRNALPKDAVAVVGVNLKSMGDKSGAKDFAGSPVAQMVGEGLSDKDRELLVSLLSDPAGNGFSTTSDAYFFVTKDNVPAILARVDDSNKVGEMLTAKAGFTPTVENGLNVAGDSNVVAVWDDNAFLFHAAAKPAAEVAAMLSLPKNEGLMSLKPAAKALTSGADFCAVMSYSAMMQVMEDMPGANANAMMAGMEMMQNAYYTVTGNFEKGRMVADAEIAFDDKESEKKYLELTSKLIGKLNGSVAKYIPEGSLLAFAGNIKGAGLYEQMLAVPEFGMIAAQAAPLKSIMEALEGDLAMALTAYDAGERMPSFVILAELSKPDVILGYASMLGAIGAKSDGENRWVLSQGSINLRFGVQDKLLYMTNDETSYSALAGGKIASIDERYGNVFKGYGGLVADVAGAGAALRSMHMVDSEYLPLFDMFGTLETSSPTAGKSHIVLTTADKEKNAAEVMYEALQMFAAGRI
jgi:hypothetical protein